MSYVDGPVFIRIEFRPATRLFASAHVSAVVLGLACAIAADEICTRLRARTRTRIGGFPIVGED
jgi:hypothetical protein